MLKITCIRKDESSVTFKLEGRITQPWIDAILHECISAFSEGRRVVLDMTDISFIDRSSIITFEALMKNRIKLIGCSPFLSALLSCQGTSFHKTNHRKK